MSHMLIGDLFEYGQRRVEERDWRLVAGCVEGRSEDHPLVKLLVANYNHIYVFV